ncbi:MAG: hypothetical protein V1770_02390 [bacterium]
MNKQYLNPKNFAETMGAYSHGLKIDVGNAEMLFVTGIRNKYFANSKPVSTLVEISNTVKQGCDIEIEVLAVREK